MGREKWNSTCSGNDGDVRAASGAAVEAGVAFVPEVLYKSKWYPICGHYFWDNKHGAETICKGLGFPTGTLQKTSKHYDSDAMRVGACKVGEQLRSCTAGGNVWGQLDTSGGRCKKGHRVGITVTCAGAE